LRFLVGYFSTGSKSQFIAREPPPIKLHTQTATGPTQRPAPELSRTLLLATDEPFPGTATKRKDQNCSIHSEGNNRFVMIHE
jgi:hypothetical protein